MLFFLIRLLSPVIQIITDDEAFVDFPETEDTTPSTDGSSTLINATAADLCSKLRALIASRFDLSADALSVSVTLDVSDGNTIVLLYSTVTLETSVEPHLAAAISDYVSDLTAAKCTVINK